MNRTFTVEISNYNPDTSPDLLAAAWVQDAMLDVLDSISAEGSSVTVTEQEPVTPVTEPAPITPDNVVLLLRDNAPIRALGPVEDMNLDEVLEIHEKRLNADEEIITLPLEATRISG
jgi:hypothetical protein